MRYVLQGSVRKAGEQLRVSAQLLDQQGVQVWGQSIDRALELEPELLRAQAARALWLRSQDPPDNAGAQRILRQVSLAAIRT